MRRLVLLAAPLLLLEFSAGFALLPTDAAAQPPTALAVWIAGARASPFYGVMVAGDTQEDRAVKLGVGVGAKVPRTLLAPTDTMPDSVVSGERVFGYTLIAAFVPLVPAMISLGSDSDTESLGWLFLGAAATLVSVPATAMVAGNTSFPRTMAGTATGFVAGALFGNVAAQWGGDLWFVPVYSVTMAAFTAAIAAR